MTSQAEQSLRDGDIERTLIELKNQIRKDPSDPASRTFLFQLLAVVGEWDKALIQLNVVADLDVKTWPMVQTYREALRCEKLRQEIFAGRHKPLVFGDPQRWIALLIESLRLIAEGEYLKAAELREEAFELAPVSSGEVDGQLFSWIADADTRFGPVLEAIINGGYYWIPFHQIKEIRLEAPEDLRDLVWLPAYFTWANEGESVGLVPSCYPGSQQSEDLAVRMGRKTEWQELPHNTFVGSGQRLLATDTLEYPLLEARRISLKQTDAVRPEDG